MSAAVKKAWSQFATTVLAQTAPPKPATVSTNSAGASTTAAATTANTSTTQATTTKSTTTNSQPTSQEVAAQIRATVNDFVSHQASQGQFVTSWLSVTNNLNSSSNSSSSRISESDNQAHVALNATILKSIQVYQVLNATSSAASSHTTQMTA